MIGLIVDGVLACAIVAAYFLGHRNGRRVVFRSACSWSRRFSRPPSFLRGQRVAPVWRARSGWDVGGGANDKLEFRSALEEVR